MSRFSTEPLVPATLPDRHKMESLAQYYPEFSQIFIESEKERISYKKNEHAYRRYMERLIVNDMNASLPKNLKFEVSILFKAKSFLSGDFCYSAKFVDDIYLLWMGDSISHGTGSSIVKEIINHIVFQVFNYYKTKHEHNLNSLVHRVQKEFTSPRVVKEVIAADLSDIIPRNDPGSKMAIVIPVVFLQIEKIQGHVMARLCNRGMPFMLNMRIKKETGMVEKVFFYTKKDVFTYQGKYSHLIEVIDSGGLPLILDKELYQGYAKRYFKKKGLKYSEAAATQEIFTISEFRVLPGDLIVIPSDGVTEILNEQKEEYGIDKFIDDLIDSVQNKEMFDRPLNEFKELYYYNTLRKYTVWNENYPITGNGVEDDMTVLFLRHR